MAKTSGVGVAPAPANIDHGHETRGTNNSTGVALEPPALSETPRARVGDVAEALPATPPDPDDDPDPKPPRGGRPVARRGLRDRIPPGGALCQTCQPVALGATSDPSNARGAPTRFISPESRSSARLSRAADAGQSSSSAQAKICHIPVALSRSSQSCAPSNRHHAVLAPQVARILRRHAVLVAAADAASIPLGLVAQAVLEGRDQVEVLAVLLCARAKRARLRSPAAFFRAKVLCRPLGAPATELRLCDWTEAKRLLVGVGVEDLGFGRCLRGLDGKSAADHWREAARARAAAAAAEKRAEQIKRLKRLLPILIGDDRRRAEQLVACA